MRLEHAHKPPQLYRDRRCTFSERMVERFGPATRFKWPPCDLVLDGIVPPHSRRKSVPLGLQDWQHRSPCCTVPAQTLASQTAARAVKREGAGNSSYCTSYTTYF